MKIGILIKYKIDHSFLIFIFKMSRILKEDDPIVIQASILLDHIKKSHTFIQTHTRLDVGHYILVFPEFCIKCVFDRDGIMIHCPPLKRINNYDYDNIIDAINDITQCININTPFDSNYYHNYLFLH